MRNERYGADYGWNVLCAEFHAEDARSLGLWRRSRMSRREIESDLVNPGEAARITKIKDYGILD